MAKCVKCGANVSIWSSNLFRNTLCSHCSTTHTDAEILNIAKRQKALNWFVVLSIPIFPVGALYGAIILRGYDLIPVNAVDKYYGFLLSIIAIIWTVLIYRLAIALKGSPFSCVIAGLIPGVNLVVLLSLSSEANFALRARGVRVGLMGARKDDLDKISRRVS